MTKDPWSLKGRNKLVQTNKMGKFKVWISNSQTMYIFREKKWKEIAYYLSFVKDNFSTKKNF